MFSRAAHIVERNNSMTTSATCQKDIEAPMSLFLLEKKEKKEK